MSAQPRESKASWQRAVWAALLVLLTASALVSCGGDDQATYDDDGRLVCPALPEADEPLPQIYVLDLEDPDVLAETHGINDVFTLSIVRRDVVDRTPVHFGWHRGGVVAPVRIWSTAFGLDTARTMPPFGVDGLRTTDDPCELRRFDALAGFYDYVAIEGTGDQARRFDVVGASDDFLTEFIGEPQSIAVDDAAIKSLLDDFADDRSIVTNRRYVIIAGLAIAALFVLWWLRSAGRSVRSRVSQQS